MHLREASEPRPRVARVPREILHRYIGDLTKISALFRSTITFSGLASDYQASCFVSEFSETDTQFNAIFYAPDRITAPMEIYL